MFNVITTLQVSEPQLKEYFQSVKSELPPVTPLYYIVFKAIELAIVNKGYIHGERIPSYEEFTKIFDVSRTTVTRALKLLEAEGLVKNMRGRGFYASWQNSPKGGVADDVHTSVSLLNQQVLSDDLVDSVPNEVVNQFDFDGAPVLKRRKTLSFDSQGRPIRCDISWYQPELSNSLLKKHFEVTLDTKLKCTVGLRKISNSIAKLLNTESDSLLFCVTQQVFEASSDKLTELTFSYINTEELSVDESSDFFTVSSGQDWSMRL